MKVVKVGNKIIMVGNKVLINQSSAPISNGLLTDLYDYWDMDTFTLSPATITGVNSNVLVGENGSDFVSSQFTNDIKSSVYSFNSTNAVNLDSTTLTLSEWSVSLWFKGIDGFNEVELLSGDPFFQYNISGKKFNGIQFDFSPSGDISWAGKTTWNTTGYNHVVLTYTNLTLSFYLNGVYLGDFSDDTSNPSILSAGGDQQYGYIDELAIWSRVLSNTDVEALYNDGTGLFYPDFN